MTHQIRSTIQRTAALLWEAFKYLGVAFYTLLAVSTVSLLWSPPENGCLTGVFGG